jgi:hypothetical protein
MSSFLKGFLLTGLPTLVLSIATAIAARSTSDLNVVIPSALVWLLAPVALLVTAIIGLSGTRFRTTREGLAGVLAGIGIAVVSLGLSCFSMWTA